MTWDQQYRDERLWIEQLDAGNYFGRSALGSFRGDQIASNGSRERR